MSSMTDVSPVLPGPAFLAGHPGVVFHQTPFSRRFFTSSTFVT